MQIQQMEPPPRPARRRKVKAQDVMDFLGPQYGPAQWHVRYSPAEELVYTILSQHTSDLNSERAFTNLMRVFESLDAVADADVSAIEEAIRRGGLAKQKAPRIKNVLNQIRDELGSFDLSFLAEMPLDEAKAWLKRLNGIGPKTAAIILCFSLGMPAMPVDTHIFRVSKRLGLIGPKVNADKAHDILEPMVAPEDVFAFHMYLIQHGRQVCKAQRPQCGNCALYWGCRERPKLEREAKRKARKPAAKRKKV
ncbi:MAG: endonuclease III [Chloroflexi bacterium]|nr:endonuclease III [Chloroflexota bacterium]